MAGAVVATAMGCDCATAAAAMGGWMIAVGAAVETGSEPIAAVTAALPFVLSALLVEAGLAANPVGAATTSTAPPATPRPRP
jgi:hypothetical protein